MIQLRMEVIAFLVLLLSIPLALAVTSSPSGYTGTAKCRLSVDPSTGLGRTICGTEMGPTPDNNVLFPLTRFNRFTTRVVSNSASLRPRDTRVASRYTGDSTLASRLCPDNKVPILETNPNQEGTVSRVVKCMPANKPVGQESINLYPRQAIYREHAESIDPYLYLQKTNRPMYKR